MFGIRENWKRAEADLLAKEFGENERFAAGFNREQQYLASFTLGGCFEAVNSTFGDITALDPRSRSMGVAEPGSLAGNGGIRSRAVTQAMNWQRTFSTSAS